MNEALCFRALLTYLRFYDRPREDWIHGHDAEKHAESVIAEMLKKFSGKSDGESSNGVVHESRANGVEASREAVSVA